MFLAGMALPPIQLGAMGLGVAVIHVILITILSNLGKCVPLPAYGDEVSIRQRLALSVGMFPRGEVGTACSWSPSRFFANRDCWTPLGYRILCLLRP